MGQLQRLVRWMFFLHDLLSIDQPGNFDISIASDQRTYIATGLSCSALSLSATPSLLRPRLSAKQATDFIGVV